MGIELGSNFDVKTGLPLDSRLKVADLTARDAIATLIRYEGMIVYVVSEGTNYQLVGGTANANWQELSGSGGSGGVNFVANGSFEKDLTGWSTYIDYLRLNAVDTVGDGIDLTKTTSGGTTQAGDFAAEMKLRYLGSVATGGLTLNNNYYPLRPISGYGTNAAWGTQLASTINGAAIDLTSTAGVGLSGFVPYRPITGAMGNYGTVDLTTVRNTADALSGKGSLQLSKPASNCLGQGLAYDFAVDRARLGRPVKLSFSYATSTAFADGDVTVWIYDKTAKRMIQVDGYSVRNSGSSLTAFRSAEWTGTFQTDAVNTDYRLILHVSSVNASAWVMLLDNVAVSPVVPVYGAITTEWKPYTPLLTTPGGAITLNATGVVNPFGWWRQVGDSIEVVAGFKNGSGGAATGTAGIARLSLPTGILIDTLKATTSAAFGYEVGDGGFFPVSSKYNPSSKVTYNAGVLQLAKPASATYYTLGDIIANGEMRISAKFPVAGWNATTLLSDTAATRRVATGMLKTSGTFPASVTIPNWTSKLEDTHDEINLTAGTVTVKVPGTRLLVANIQVATSDTTVFGPRVNGVYVNAWTVDSVSAFYKTSVAVLHDLKVGDVIAIVNGGSGTGTIANARFSTVLIQGPAQIAAATKIFARYATATAQSIATATATIVNYDTKTTDNMSIVTTGAAWKATAQAPGDYEVEAKIGFTLFNVTGTVIYLSIFKNGVEFSRTPYVVTSGVSQLWGTSITDTVPMVVGDYLDVRVYQSSGASQTLIANAAINTISIKRLSGVN